MNIKGEEGDHLYRAAQLQVQLDQSADRSPLQQVEEENTRTPYNWGRYGRRKTRPMNCQTTASCTIQLKGDQVRRSGFGDNRRRDSQELPGKSAPSAQPPTFIGSAPNSDRPVLQH